MTRALLPGQVFGALNNVSLTAEGRVGASLRPSGGSSNTVTMDTNLTGRGVSAVFVCIYTVCMRVRVKSAWGRAGVVCTCTRVCKIPLKFLSVSATPNNYNSKLRA